MACVRSMMRTPPEAERLIESIRNRPHRESQKLQDKPLPAYLLFRVILGAYQDADALPTIYARSLGAAVLLV